MDFPKPDEAREVRVNAEALLEQSQTALRAAVEVVTGNPEDDPQVIFPAPGEKRELGGFGLDLDSDQEDKLRGIAAELGFGRTTDRTAEDAGLKPGYVGIIDGGQVHKVRAEIELALEDTVQPSALIVVASGQRKIDGADPKQAAEAASIRKQLGLADDQAIEETEYTATEKLLAALPGFVPLEEPEVLPFGYDIQADSAAVAEPTGQFVRWGEVGSRPVILMRIDREDYVDDQGTSKYRKQPDNGTVMRLVHQLLNSTGDTESQIGFATSATYQASRQVDAVRTGLETGRGVTIATYGTARLAAVKGENEPKPPALNQLTGELRRAAEQAEKLEKLLHPPTQEV